MRFISNELHFQKELLRVKRIFNLERDLPNQIFKKPYKFYLIDFDYIYSSNFFNIAQKIMKNFNEEKFFLMVIDPDPEEYFYKNFGKFSLIEASDNDSSEDYLKILDADPGDSPADSILSNSFKMVIYGDSLQWALLADRENELSILGISKSLIIQNNFSEDIQNISSITELSNLENFGFEISDDFCKNFLENYKTK